VECVAGDVLDPSGLPEATAGADVVFHLAGRTKARSREEFLRTNRDGTFYLLDAIRKAGTAPRLFVLISSLSAAGPSPDGTPLREEDAPGPVSHYGQSKLAAERVLQEFPRSYPGLILRPGVVYGPRERDILQVIRWANRGVKLLPRQKRLFSAIHVSDLVKAMIRGTERAPKEDRVYFLSDGETYDWEECLDCILRLLGRQARALRFSVPACRRLASWTAAAGWPVFLLDKLRELSHPYWLCAIQRARDELGFEPSIRFQEGIAGTLGWYREHGWL